MANEMTINHYAAVVLNAGGNKVRGYDYRQRKDAEAQQARLKEAGCRSEIWAMNIYGERLMEVKTCRLNWTPIVEEESVHVSNAKT
jgi:hypothetical protein